MTIKTKLALATAGVLGTITFLGATNNVEAEEIATDGGTQWRVEQGDTLSTIANNYGIDYTQIHESNKNKVPDPNVIYVGDVLDVPVKSDTQVEVEEYFGSRDQEDVVQQPQETEGVEQPVEEPVVEQEVAVEEQPQEEATQNPVEEPEPAQEASGSEAEAKSWIANKESTNNYGARNGRYIGKFQLDQSYLNGDHSPANQEKVANEYVNERYGSWVQAKQAWQQKGWY